MILADDAPRANPAKVRMAQEWKHTSPLIACRFDPTGRFVVASSQDSTLQRWELEGGKKTELAGHASWVRALAFVPGQPILISGDYHGKVLWWNSDDETPKPVRSIDAHDGWVRMVAVSPDGQLLATCGNDQLVKLWSAVDGKPIRQFAGHGCHVYNVAFHPDGKSVVSGDHKGVVKQWDLEKGTVTREFDAKLLHKYDTTFAADIGGVRAMNFNRDGSLLACGGITDVTNAFAGIGKPIILLYDWATGNRKQMLRPKENFQGTVWGAVFHPDGFLAGVGGGAGGAMWFWKPEQPQDFFTLKLPTNARDLTLHPDGLRLAVPFFDGAVRLYDMTPKSPA